MTATNVNYVLFDLYRTLIDIDVDEDAIAVWIEFTAFLSSKGLKVSPEDLRGRFYTLREKILLEGRSDGFVMDQLFENLLNPWKDELSEAIEAHVLGKQFRKVSTVSLTVRPYTLPLMKRIRHSGCKIALVSNTESIFTREDLKSTGIDDKFDVTILSSDVHVKKPDPRIFSLAMEAISATPSQSIFVGDNFEDDINGAHGAGIPSIYLNNDGNYYHQRTNNDLPQIIGVYPTLESILQGLRKLGWHG